MEEDTTGAEPGHEEIRLLVTTVRRGLELRIDGEYLTIPHGCVAQVTRILHALAVLPSHRGRLEFVLYGLCKNLPETDETSK